MTMPALSEYFEMLHRQKELMREFLIFAANHPMPEYYRLHIHRALDVVFALNGFFWWELPNEARVGWAPGDVWKAMLKMCLDNPDSITYGYAKRIAVRLGRKLFPKEIQVFKDHEKEYLSEFPELRYVD